MYKINKIHGFEELFKNALNDKIKDVEEQNKNSIVVLLEDVQKFDKGLEKYLKDEPEKAIEDSFYSLINILEGYYGKDSLPNEKYFIHITTNRKSCSCRITLYNLNTKWNSKLIITEGIVSEVKPPRIKLKLGVFECVYCGALIQVPQLTNKIRYPQSCLNKRCLPYTGSKEDFQLINKKSYWSDYQIIAIRNNARKIKAILTNDLVEAVMMGDFIEITGIYKTDNIHTKRTRKKDFIPGIIEVNYIKKIKKSRPNGSHNGII